MNVLTSEAVQGLATAMDTLLPEALRSSLLILPIHSAPTGLGGFVGLNDAPAGEIVGRRLRASMLLTLQAADAAQLGRAVTSAVDTVLALDRATLLAQGILRLTFDSLGPEISRPGSSDLHRELSFHVLYEFLKKPTASEGIVETIPITMAVGMPDLTVRVLARVLFTRIRWGSSRSLTILSPPREPPHSGSTILPRPAWNSRRRSVEDRTTAASPNRGRIWCSEPSRYDLQCRILP